MAPSRDPIPDEFDSIEEIQDFWDTRSTADHWDEMTDVDFELSPALKSRIELRKLYRLLGFSPVQIAKIEERAREAKTNSRQLIRSWVLEHV